MSSLSPIFLSFLLFMKAVSPQTFPTSDYTITLPIQPFEDNIPFMIQSTSLFPQNIPDHDPHTLPQQIHIHIPSHPLNTMTNLKIDDQDQDTLTETPHQQPITQIDKISEIHLPTYNHINLLSNIDLPSTYQNINTKQIDQSNTNYTIISNQNNISHVIHSKLYGKERTDHQMKTIKQKQFQSRLQQQPVKQNINTLKNYIRNKPKQLEHGFIGSEQQSFWKQPTHKYRHSDTQFAQLQSPFRYTDQQQSEQQMMKSSRVVPLIQNKQYRKHEHPNSETNYHHHNPSPRTHQKYQYHHETDQSHHYEPLPRSTFPEQYEHQRNSHQEYYNQQPIESKYHQKYKNQKSQTDVHHNLSQRFQEGKNRYGQPY